MTTIPVLVDCDPGHDDALALLLAAGDPRHVGNDGLDLGNAVVTKKLLNLTNHRKRLSLGGRALLLGSAPHLHVLARRIAKRREQRT